MWQLIKFLIFGKECKHKMVFDSEVVRPLSGIRVKIYICTECGKIKKVSMGI